MLQVHHPLYRLPRTVHPRIVLADRAGKYKPLFKDFPAAPGQPALPASWCL